MFKECGFLVFNHDRPGDVSRQDGYSIGKDGKYG